MSSDAKGRNKAMSSSTTNFDSIPTRKWSADQVAAWLTTREGVSADVPKMFKDHDICGTVLLDLTLPELSEIGISKLGDRKRIFGIIQQQRKDAGVNAPSEEPHNPTGELRNLSKASLLSSRSNALNEELKQLREDTKENRRLIADPSKPSDTYQLALHLSKAATFVNQQTEFGILFDFTKADADFIISCDHNDPKFSEVADMVAWSR